MDAFPFKGDETLWGIARRAAKGRILYSTATLDPFTEKMVGQVRTLRLQERPHRQPIPVPKLCILPKVFQLLYTLCKLYKSKRRLILFVPSRDLCRILYRFFSLFVSCTLAYSDLPEREANIASFRDGKGKLLVATTVLERGVTFKDIDVAVYDWLPGVFDKASLIQMSGRAGRNFLSPEGEVTIYTAFPNEEVRSCIREIKEANATLSVLS